MADIDARLATKISAEAISLVAHGMGAGYPHLYREALQAARRLHLNGHRGLAMIVRRAVGEARCADKIEPRFFPVLSALGALVHAVELGVEDGRVSHCAAREALGRAAQHLAAALVDQPDCPSVWMYGELSSHLGRVAGSTACHVAFDEEGRCWKWIGGGKRGASKTEAEAQAAALAARGGGIANGKH